MSDHQAAVLVIVLGVALFLAIRLTLWLVLEI
jgi:hypothetical protein